MVTLVSLVVRLVYSIICTTAIVLHMHAVCNITVTVPAIQVYVYIENHTLVVI